MNRSIQDNNEIRGLRTKNQEFKLCTFADDLAITLEDPLNSYNALKEEFGQYAEAAGMKINFNKTKLLIKNVDQSKVKQLQELTGIQVANKIKYLGIYIMNRLSSLFKDNYEKILKEIKKIF